MSTVAFLSSDLLFQSRVAGVVAAARLSLIADRSPEKLIAKVSKDDELKFLIVDLTLDLADLGAILESFRSQHPHLVTVAYGPHVHEAKLQRAVEAGFDQVMTRGQFDRQMSALIGGP